MRAGEETLRHSIAAATDPRTRARLRVDLAELLRARDAAAARAELDQALREGGPSGAVTAAALSFARRLPAGERLTWLSGLTKAEGKTPAPQLVSALAEAQRHRNHAGNHRQAGHQNRSHATFRSMNRGGDR